MQNVTLPNADEVAQQEPSPLRPWAEEEGREGFDVLMAIVIRMGIMERFIQALYAKHGEDCPLFKEGE